MFQHILVPVDFSDTSRGALTQGARLAEAHAAKLTILHVGLLPGTWAGASAYAAPAPKELLAAYDEAAREQRAALDRLADAEVPGSVARRVHVREGEVVAEILAEVKESDVDLVVMGSHGRTGVKKALLGSVAGRVLRLSPTPVLVVKP